MKQINSETGICFFRVGEPVLLSQLLRGADFSPLSVQVDGAHIARWFEFGCIYVDGLRTRQDSELAPNQVIRVHTRPKHFSFPPLLPLVVENNAEFLVLNKPAGVPTHPTLDNYVENAKIQLEREMGIPLYVTHRLDVATQGLLVIAKTPPAQSLLNRMFSQGRVDKTYRSRNTAAVACGAYTHYMDPQSRVPKLVSSELQPGWWTCRLELKRAEPLTGGEFGHEIALLTGKTHQIRAQMAALGAPIVGDVTYGGAPAREMQLECFRMSFKFRSTDYSITRPHSLLGWPS